MSFSPRYRFSDWPNQLVPLNTAGVYSIWDDSRLIYVGMSGRQIESNSHKKRYGLYNRLNAHASGRLSGDQFCVYVANRIVIPTINSKLLPQFESGELTLDQLTKEYIHSHFEYQYCVVKTSQEAFAIEADGRSGNIFGERPLLNPKG
jgi:hypothetical protein